MTTFPPAKPALDSAEHPRNTSHIRAGAAPSFPPGPVPIDAPPTVEPAKILQGAAHDPATGAPGLAPTPTN
jgi:hypothetical protein